MPARAKFSTLAAEVSRRLRNTSDDVEDSVKANILTVFSKAMQSSGYTVLATTKAIWSGIKGHNNTLERRDKGKYLEVDKAWDSRGKKQLRKLKKKVAGS